MQDEGTCTLTEDNRQTEATILCLLLDPKIQRPWAVDEVIREIGRPIDTNDALARLQAAGLVHRVNGFVFATRAALRLDQIAL
jgi:hypothetical protein